MPDPKSPPDREVIDAEFEEEESIPIAPMNPNDFCRWLEGFFAATKELNTEQIEIVRKNLEQTLRFHSIWPAFHSFGAPPYQQQAYPQQQPPPAYPPYGAPYGYPTAPVPPPRSR